MPQLEDLVDPGAELVKLAGNFGLIEGPIWLGDCLYFNDIPGATRYAWDEKTGLRMIATQTNKANGMDFDARGRVFVCEHTTSMVTSFPDPESDDGRKVVASHYQGKELNSPNDVVCAADGTVYFTDPLYGRANELVGLVREPELDFRGVYRVAPDGGPAAITLVADGFEGPNGLCFSPDGKILYVNDTPRKHIRAFDVQPDGSVTGGRVLVDFSDESADGGVDGMECDERGNVWVTGPGGIWAVSPSGEKIGAVAVPERALSLVWGGPDTRDLFLTTWSSLYRIKTKVSGHRTFDL